MQVIDRNARALSRMIDELLDLSIVTNRKLRLIRERTEMNEWARATLETIRPELGEKGTGRSSSFRTTSRWNWRSIRRAWRRS